jgi:ElaB/YqjD/DUF883 family membrane-anchored ribosome-binding protein
MTIDQGGGVAAQAKEQAQQKADEVKAKASDRIHEQLDQRSTELGEQVTSFGKALRKAGLHLEIEGSTNGAKIAHQAADRVEQVGGYLSGSSSDKFIGDVENFGRQRPWAAGVVGAALGFVAARFLKASSESRYSTSYQSRYDAEMPLGRDTTTILPQPPTVPVGPPAPHGDPYGGTGSL